MFAIGEWANCHHCEARSRESCCGARDQIGERTDLRGASYSVIAAMAAGFALSACATNPPGSSPGSASAPAPVASALAAPASAATRDLTPEEKKVIIEAVAPSLRNPGAAKYRWAKLSTAPAEDGSFNYCATVDAQSPYAAYNGRQAYIVELKMSFGKVTGAVMGLITGGKDTAIVANMCAKYGLDPNKAI